MNNKTKIASVIGSILLSAAVTGTAQAGAVAQSIVLIDDFTISNSNGIMDRSDFSLLNFTGTTDTFADLNSTAPASDGDISSNGSLMDLYSTVGAGAGTPADNSFTPIPNAPGPGNFATADTYDFGSPITDVGGIVPLSPLFTSDATFVPGGAVTPGVDTFLGTASYVHLEDPDVGTATSNNSLEARFNIIVNEDGVLDFDFSASVFVSAFLNLDAISPSVATAAGSITFSMLDVSTGLEVLDESTSAFIAGPGFDFSFGAPRASNAPGDGIPKVFTTGGFTPLSFSTDSLVAGTEYQLTARMTSQADATKAIPEPGALIMMGVGLLGVALRKKAV